MLRVASPRFRLYDCLAHGLDGAVGLFEELFEELGVVLLLFCGCEAFGLEYLCCAVVGEGVGVTVVADEYLLDDS